MSKKPRLSQETRDEIVRQYLAGMRAVYISESVGVCRRTVYVVIANRGITLRGAQAVPVDFSPIPRNGRYLSDEHREAIARDFASGLSGPRVGRMHGCSPTTVYLIAEKLGVILPPGPQLLARRRSGRPLGTPVTLPTVAPVPAQVEAKTPSFTQQRRNTERRAPERAMVVPSEPTRTYPRDIDHIGLARRFAAGEFDSAELSRLLRGQPPRVITPSLEDA